MRPWDVSASRKRIGIHLTEMRVAQQRQPGPSGLVRDRHAATCFPGHVACEAQLLLEMLMEIAAKPGTVLYVDATPVNVLAMQWLFHDGQHVDLFVAASGAEAWAAASTFDPALLLLNIMLPDCRGGDLLRRLRVLPGCKGVPAVAIAGEPGFDARRLGFAECWLMPLDGRSVMDSVEKLLLQAGPPSPLPPSPERDVPAREVPDERDPDAPNDEGDAEISARPLESPVPSMLASSAFGSTGLTRRASRSLWRDTSTSVARL